MIWLIAIGIEISVMCDEQIQALLSSRCAQRPPEIFQWLHFPFLKKSVKIAVTLVEKAFECDFSDSKRQTENINSSALLKIY